MQIEMCGEEARATENGQRNGDKRREYELQ
jgi:hypothetical protein